MANLFSLEEATDELRLGASSAPEIQAAAIAAAHYFMMRERSRLRLLTLLCKSLAVIFNADERRAAVHGKMDGLNSGQPLSLVSPIFCGVGPECHLGCHHVVDVPHLGKGCSPVHPPIKPGVVGHRAASPLLHTRVMFLVARACFVPVVTIVASEMGTPASVAKT